MLGPIAQLLLPSLRLGSAFCRFPNGCVFNLWVSCTVHGTHKNEIQQFFFKTGFYGTIHTFKNYFTTLFSVFSNKRYPNRPQMSSLLLHIGYARLLCSKLPHCVLFATLGSKMLSATPHNLFA